MPRSRRETGIQDNSGEAGMTLLDLLPRFHKKSGQQRQKTRSEYQPGIGQDAPLRGRPAARSIPLSAGQERCWFLAQLTPDRAADHLAVALHLQGPLDQARLESSLQTTIARHEALRTIFVSAVGHPRQYILPELKLPLPLTDIQDTPAAEQQQRIQAFLRHQVQIPFYLHQHPLVRAHLLRVAPDDHILILVSHALVADQHSLQMLAAEMAAHYNTQSGQSISPKTYQFNNFLRWQEAWEQTDLGDAARRYWVNQLKDNQTLLELPADRSRPPQPSLRAAQHPFILTPITEEKLQLAKCSHTPELVLLTAWYILLFRYTRQHDITVGTMATNCHQAHDRGVIGPCYNQIALRSHLAGEQTGHQLLTSLRETWAAARTHQHLPFADVVNLVQPVRELSHTPLFQVMFLWEALPISPPFMGLKSEWVDVFGEATRYDLSLGLTHDRGTISGKIIYSTDLFTADTIARLAAQYQQLVTALLDDLDCPISHLSLLPPDQHYKMLRLWNNTAMPYLRDRCIHHYFEKQATQKPTQVGLYANGRFWQYQELNAQANRLAHYLCAQGIRPGDLVGVCLERSADLLIALLAILKSGAAYVPLDPAYPVARITFILEDAQVALLLTQPELQQQLPQTPHVPHLYLSEVQTALATQPDINPDISFAATSLAYIIYTSGSTGQPKGVEITHRNAGAFISWARTQFSDAELTAVLATTSICFDLSIFELFVPLASGGMVVLVENILALVDQPLPVQLTLINTVPSAALELVQANAIPSSVITVNLAGEPFRYQLVRHLYSCGVKRVYNLYGPSEYTTYTTCALLDPHDQETDRPPIGRPIANTQIYLLDEHQQPVPIGVIGEVYIGGEGLARGYWRRPNLTQEKFITSPFDAQQRLYRTGDLAKYQANGELEFIGRQDHQIKLRGYRIELGEIETVLEEHPAVLETAVVVQEQAHTHVLVAYLSTPPAQTESLIPELRHFLEQKLPGYMIPAHFQVLPALPRTPNGKIDRQRLPKFRQTSATSLELDTDTLDPLQARLAQIWQEVLGVPFVKTTDDFFDLGGNSLLAVRLMARIEQEFGCKLPLSTLF